MGSRLNLPIHSLKYEICLYVLSESLDPVCEEANILRLPLRFAKIKRVSSKPDQELSKFNNSRTEFSDRHVVYTYTTTSNINFKCLILLFVFFLAGRWRGGKWSLSGAACRQRPAAFTQNTIRTILINKG